MSGETEDQISGWTTDTLREHLLDKINKLSDKLDERYQFQNDAIATAFAAQQTAMTAAFAAADKAVQAAITGADKAVGKAEMAAEKRFDSVNEFRAQLADQAATFMPKAEAEVISERNTERIDNIDKQMIREVTRVTDLVRTTEDSIRTQINSINTTMSEYLSGATAKNKANDKIVAYIIGASGFLLGLIIFVVNVLTK